MIQPLCKLEVGSVGNPRYASCSTCILPCLVTQTYLHVSGHTPQLPRGETTPRHARLHYDGRRPSTQRDEAGRRTWPVTWRRSSEATATRPAVGPGPSRGAVAPRPPQRGRPSDLARHVAPQRRGHRDEAGRRTWPVTWRRNSKAIATRPPVGPGPSRGVAPRLPPWTWRPATRGGEVRGRAGDQRDARCRRDERALGDDGRGPRDASSTRPRGGARDGAVRGARGERPSEPGGLGDHVERDREPGDGGDGARGAGPRRRASPRQGDGGRIRGVSPLLRAAGAATRRGSARRA